ncbi:MAG: glycosyltransferase family 87 protein [Gemmatimonadota bacterium]
MRKLSRWGVFVAGAAMFVSSFLDLESPGDYTHFVAFGEAALEGLVPYPDAATGVAGPGGGPWATWPPGFVPLASLLARLDGMAHAPTVVSFQLLNLAMLAVALWVVVAWTTGRRPVSRSPDPDGRLQWDAPLVAVALLVPFRMVLSNFEHAQVNLVVLGLVLLGFYLLDRRPLAGGLLFGLGSAVKATPVALLAYLAWRGRTRALAFAAGGVAVGWFGLPAMVLGPDGAVEWWRAWIGALPHAAGQESWMNQSLRSVATLGFGPGPGDVAWMLGTAGLAIGIAAAFGRPFRAVGARRTAAEIAILLVAVTIVSPVSWKAHYVTLVPLCAAVLVLARRADRGRRRAGLVGLVIAGVGFNITSPEIVGWAAMTWLEERGLVLWFALSLLALGLFLLPGGREVPEGASRA